MTKFKVWLKAFRLRTLPLSLSGIILGSALAFNQGADLRGILPLALLTTILFQILSNLANDLGDFQKGTDNEQRIGPERSLQSGAITLKQMRFAVFLFALLGVVSAASLIYISWPNLTTNTLFIYAGLGLASIWAAMAYTMGKGAYGYRGLGDIMVFLFFGVVSVVGVYGLYGVPFDWTVFTGALGVGCWSVGVLNLNNLRDHENDAAMGKRTIVVKMGFDKGKSYQMILIVVGLLSFALTFWFNKALAICALPVYSIIPHLQRVKKCSNPKELDKELKIVALSTFIACSLAALFIYVG